jgi:NADH-quinone oxidoreductase subunit C
MQPKDPVAAVREAFPQAVQAIEDFRGETTIQVAPEQIVDVARFLRDTDGLIYDFLVDETGVDYLPEAPRFAILYHLYSMLYNRKLTVRVRVAEPADPDELPVVPSVAGLWPTADWQEREIYDMFGIRFEGHPNMRRILNPVDWDGYPQRKDYPLGYETVQFSFNFDEIQKHKPFAKE